MFSCRNLQSLRVLVKGSGAGAQRKCPVVVSCDEKRQFSCSACKLAWRITDTQPRYIAQVSHRGSCSRRKIPSKLWLWWRVNSTTGLGLLKEWGNCMSADPVSSSKALLLDWMMCVIPGDFLFLSYSCALCEIRQNYYSVSFSIEIICCFHRWVTKVVGLYISDTPYYTRSMKWQFVDLGLSLKVIYKCTKLVKKILPFIWMLLQYLPNIQMFLHKPHGNNERSFGWMAAWWNEGKCAVVNDRTPQSLLNSSPLIRVDPHRALTRPNLPAPAPGAQWTRELQKKKGGEGVCWE